ncbi:uncharacterized protein [Malus domestica]|uniref:uncharacterized protein isoform X1 n=1 Tax=Malus domestica TaxID=3750 RepID=UPI003974D110
MEEQESEVSFGYGQEDGYDAVVVGSGYGGSVAACRLSMAGVRVCLVEKGRRWESKDFPTDSSKIFSAVRMENQNLGISFGPKDALFQVYEQNDSLAAMACGLGGGSLVNAGVLVPAPARARRNPKWPKDWERNWDNCEASAAAMLKAQSIPVKFPAAKVLEEVAIGEIEEAFETSVKLSMNFDLEEPQNDAMGSCLACGNCLSGCPFNAKSSTDKNYLRSAIQACCIVKTECQVQYVVRNVHENFQYKGESGRKNRRWLIYLNEIDYITSDFVILSAGVFGTTKILYQSRMRGLKLSEALGSGFSCNGNTVAYLAGSPAPLNGYGLDRKQMFKTPFEERPGPSISASYTSSLGFTIQSAVLPTSYPYLLFKGITTYGWPTGYWFLHGIIDKIKHIIGCKATQAIVLIALGYDESDGKITLEKGTNKICFTPPHDSLLPRKITAFQKLTKKLGGILFMSKYRSASVHLLGGCNASSDPSHGVCNSNGQVFDPVSPITVHPGLYVCDASLIPCSIGINPSLTIATAAEHISKNLVQDALMYREGLASVPKIANQGPDSFTDKTMVNGQRSEVLVKETMRGYVGGMPCAAYLRMKMNPQDQKGPNEQKLGTQEAHSLLRGKVGGHVKLRAFEKDDLHVLDGDVNFCEVDCRTPYTQYMHYHLLLGASTGSRYILEGRKIMNPYLSALYAWREMTTLHVTFVKVAEKNSKDEKVVLKGELSISMKELLKSFISLEGNKRGRFFCHLLGALLRTYILQIPRGNHKDLDSSYFQIKSYPSGILHELKTEDEFNISCRQWKCHHILPQLKGNEQLNPVLLLNGYSTESYWLPTEPNDLVRTLLEGGHETWLLQSRLHPLNLSNSFTIEDIARFDIAAAINKIVELHGPRVKVHVVAHCVGGLAIHIAVMGGHVSATRIASLSCTNSSMFFKLSPWSRVKMWLPLMPISMFILGNDKTLPLLETSTVSLRHSLLKLIARFIPRYERCTCNECEVFSGIFGNTFWHKNISPTMHQWLNKQSSSKLPMAAFPHLRKICNSGFIVDSNGSNSYLIHPERMALPTLYISGGRSLLVTPHTSFLAHKYMKLHQPGFHHERVVVEGFGHSDLLIGEDSHKEVFPHILSHIRFAESGRSGKGKRFRKEVLDWEADDLYEGFGEFGTWFSPPVVVVLLFMLFFLLVSLFL